MKTNLHNHHAQPYSGVYSLHKYWSKKPQNIIKELIECHSSEGDLILDAFCGSGISVLEGLSINRRIIGIDINPISIFITRQLLAEIDIVNLKDEFEKIEKEIKNEIFSFYKTNKDNRKFVASHFIWNENNLLEVWYKNGTNSLTKVKTDHYDLNLAKSFSYTDIEHFYPTNRLLENSRINVGQNVKIFELFTPRNLKALALLFSHIKRINDPKIKDILKFCFTSSLGQSSNMVFVLNKKINKLDRSKLNRSSKTVGSWVIGYWRPKEHFELNVWNCFENKYKKVIHAKENQAMQNHSYKESASFQDFLNKRGDFVLINNPAQNVLKQLPNSSVDYVITDPPHGDRIPYLELSQLWNSWLGNDVNYEDEIIISTSKDRKKTTLEYNNQLNLVFSEIYRVLKPNHNFTLLFNSLDDNTWINIVTTLNSIGFKLFKIETLGYSSTSVVQNNRDTGLKTDFILTYKKETVPLSEIYLLNGLLGEDALSRRINYVIIKKGIRKKYEILNELFFYFLRKNQFFKLSQAIRLINKQI
ncbi:MAG: hypothetical protein MUO72_05855 [Bacteroidales bacterium]|nr:hypothetical protein [Bacteroidales bacterium]